ncbi:MAG: hypothetical protein Q7U68_00580 [Candidatus Roizmanbacteria bacterium]|nr:hypothetical protein [Candidatus Roizmanbacteria bacterium]
MVLVEAKTEPIFKYRTGSFIGIREHRERSGSILCPSLIGIVTAFNPNKKKFKVTCDTCKRPAKIDWGQEHKNRMALYV